VINGKDQRTANGVCLLLESAGQLVGTRLSIQRTYSARLPLYFRRRQGTRERAACSRRFSLLMYISSAFSMALDDCGMERLVSEVHARAARQSAAADRTPRIAKGHLRGAINGFGFRSVIPPAGNTRSKRARHAVLERRVSAQGVFNDDDRRVPRLIWLWLPGRTLRLAAGTAARVFRAIVCIPQRVHPHHSFGLNETSTQAASVMK
jgi:hypothetical protein